MRGEIGLWGSAPPRIICCHWRRKKSREIHSEIATMPKSEPTCWWPISNTWLGKWGCPGSVRVMPSQPSSAPSAAMTKWKNQTLNSTLRLTR